MKKYAPTETQQWCNDKLRQQSDPTASGVFSSPEALAGSDGAGGEARETGSAEAYGAHEEYLKKAVIVMVDDEPLTTEVLQTYLEESGYENVRTTTDSTTAVDLIRQETPDVVFLDLIMPEVNGFEILRAVRADEDLKYLPVIVLTSSTDSATKLKVLELGATDFLGKPVDPSELMLRLRNTLTAKAYQDHLAYYDGLTGLPNRRMFIERVDWALKLARRDQRTVAVMHLGLDRFKTINDTLGIKTGDRILAEVARRLEIVVRESDALGSTGDGGHGRRLFSRVGGDEFSVLLAGIADAESASVVARRIIAELEEPLLINGEEVFVTTSIGIAVYPNDGTNVDALLKNAGVATSHAKRLGRNGFQYYSKNLNAKSAERLRMENLLRRALQHRELVLFYQPKVDVGSGAVVGVEALLRWKQPDLGLVAPDVFVPVAEETGQILGIGEWVMREACRQCKAWHDGGFHGLSVSVNVSGHQFQQANFVELVADALSSNQLDPGSLTIELTESVIMDDAQSNVITLHRIKNMGVKLSIDDFGTGYSSLSYLKQFPLDELKIDRSFISDLDDHADNAAIVNAIIAMTHGLGLSVVAEGVETESQHRFLKDKDCDQIQGFLFSRPIPAEAMVPFLHRWNGERARIQATSAGGG